MWCDINSHCKLLTLSIIHNNEWYSCYIYILIDWSVSRKNLNNTVHIVYVIINLVNINTVITESWMKENRNGDRQAA